jgi:hypothetical protein
MLFRLSLHAPADTGATSGIGGDGGQGARHVGVLEFSAPEGVVIVPLWIM